MHYYLLYPVAAKRGGERVKVKLIFRLFMEQKDGKIQIGDSSQPQDFHLENTKIGVKL